jgi:hypothetical protein
MVPRVMLHASMFMPGCRHRAAEVRRHGMMAAELEYVIVCSDPRRPNDLRTFSSSSIPRILALRVVKVEAPREGGMGIRSSKE